MGRGGREEEGEGEGCDRRNKDDLEGKAGGRGREGSDTSAGCVSSRNHLSERHVAVVLFKRNNSMILCFVLL